ncbi:DUF2306 domain-containing protein [Sphingomonas ginkgonis]|uniref:DUF2306 domain-containing protein n=1 Tax=Sphingomonas ginkgonis TaxID=2315330 RepID=A0A3R9Z5S6_9SPHN|nr:DUF2306 domain-containing protein [Sphingomonas ginkgonis]RST30431.1 DUF2306 domain-containing protein [Sphingomonas ginkgonis]
MVSVAEPLSSGTSGTSVPLIDRVVRWSGWTLAGSVWASGAVFGLYMLLFFGGTALHGTLDRWNESLDFLHPANAPSATAGIGVHFLAGGLLLILGPLQLMGSIRRAYPALHRWLGRIYVAAAGIAGVGGLVFILVAGTIGGPVMNVGLAGYGVLVTLCSVKAYTEAQARRFERHRAWAIRLFSLVVGSWLFRIDYGFWFMIAGKVGHTHLFRGPFDYFMDFFFYLPNLVVAELFIRTRRMAPHSALKAGAAAVLVTASAFVLTASFYFAVQFWVPGMVSGVTGAPL